MWRRANGGIFLNVGNRERGKKEKKKIGEKGVGRWIMGNEWKSYGAFSLKTLFLNSTTGYIMRGEYICWVRRYLGS